MENEIDLKYLNEKDQELFKLLSSKDQRGEISAEELIEFAILYEFMHVEEISFEIYERLLKENPTNSWAVFWYSYFLLIYRPPIKAEEREKILKFIDHLISQSGQFSGMGYYLKSWFVRDVNYFKNIKTRTIEEIYYQCQAMHHCPDWSTNYYGLARFLEAEGVLNEAMKLYEIAQEKFSMSMNPDWLPSRRYFEECVSGRIPNGFSYEDGKKRIIELRERIENKRAEVIEIEKPKRRRFAFFRKGTK